MGERHRRVAVVPGDDAAPEAVDATLEILRSMRRADEETQRGVRPAAVTGKEGGDG